MADTFISVALVDCDKFVKGTILTLHSTSKFNWGDGSDFFLAKAINLTPEQIEEINLWKLGIDFDVALSSQSYAKYLKNKTDYHDLFRNAVKDESSTNPDYHAKETLYKNEYDAFGEKPDFSKAVDFKDPHVSFHTPEWQWKKVPEPIAEEKGI